MKNWSIFAVSRQKTIIALLGAGIFISTLIEHRVLGLPISNGFCTVRSEIVFAEMGDSAALFLYPYFNFSYMAKTMKNCGTANHSTRTSTSAHETSCATVLLPILNPNSIPCFEDFIAEARRRFDIEKNAKNEAYAFIADKGLFPEFRDYTKSCIGK